MTEPVIAEPIAPPSVLLGRVKRWSGILAAFFSAQSAVQLLGIGAGLLFVNFLPVEQFALYTLANSVLSFFTFASDLGSTSSLVYFYRATAGEPDGFETMQAAVASLRRMAFLAGALVTAIALPAAAQSRGLPLRDALFCTVGVVAAVWFQIEASLGVLILRLRNAYGRSYRAELAGGLLRLTLAAALVALGGRLAWLAVLTGTAASAVVAILTRARHQSTVSDLGPARRRVLRYLTPSLPSALYFSIQGPLVVWLSATFGSTRTIAEVGAIGRLGLLVGIFGSLTSVVFLPHLARIHDERRYRWRVVQFGSLHVALGGLLFLAAALAPQLFLALLGPNYKGLHSELLLVVGSAWLTLLGGYLVGVNLSRAWNRWETVAVAILFVCQVLFIVLLPLSTAHGVIRFGLLSAATGMLLQVAITLLGFTRPSIVHWKT
jgi:O-antigen/teichoic acid export membrane protein